MRHIKRALAIAALGSVLWPGVARASLASDVFQQAFGEASPTALAFHVDLSRAAVRPRSLADLNVSLPGLASVVYQPVRFDPQGAAPYGDRLTVPSLAADASAMFPPEPTVAYYEDAVPQPTSPPAYSRFDLDGASGGLSEELLAPGRVGRVNFVTHAGVNHTPMSAVSLNQTGIGAGATIDARVGSRRVGLDFSSRLDRYVNTDANSIVGLSNQMLPVYVPAGADINTKSLSAGLAVPVSKRMTANFGVESQHLLSDLMPFDAYNTIYGAGLTYKMKGPGAISLFARQYRYQDNLIPQNAFTQTSANVSFTVRF